ncbi:MAG: hypothetical protein F6K65_21435 [Moorea sp. SIO3C2]|nr:hypothetical protein [Moorena sp. SIO3C2]
MIHGIPTLLPEAWLRSLLAEAEAVGHALRSRSVGFAETLPERSVALRANRITTV